MKITLLLLLGLAACAPNLLDDNDYRGLLRFDLLCHKDGSVILAQRANSSGGFTEPSETPAPCTEAEAVSLQDIIAEKNRPRDYRWLGRNDG